MSEQRDPGWSGVIAGEPWQRIPSTINRGWRYSIGIGPLLDAFNEDEPGDVKALAAKIVEALKASRDYLGQGSNARAGAELREVIEDFADAENEREANAALATLYDWGDEFRVIIR